MLAVAPTIDIQVIAIIIPACESPCWKVVTLPLFQEIRFARGLTVRDILAWGKRQKYPGNFTRQLLAWLSFNDLICFDDVKKMWVAL